MDEYRLKWSSREVYDTYITHSGKSKCRAMCSTSNLIPSKYRSNTAETNTDTDTLILLRQVTYGRAVCQNEFFTIQLAMFLTSQ